MELADIYQPIREELREVEEVLASCLGESKNKSMLNLARFLLKSAGKKLRPALVILSAKAASDCRLPLVTHQLASIAAAVELIHTASLIHDDVIDHAVLRHNKPTVNRKWGSEVSIALGDYLYSVGFGLVSVCSNTDILKCISSAAKSMCEGELIQVCERDDLNLLRERYIIIVKKKTASLFAGSCQAGAIVTSRNRVIQGALKEYGLNFGIAFQIIDDCLDLIGRTQDLGKTPGADFRMGELTLPLLNLLAQNKKDREKIIKLIKKQDRQGAFKEIRQRFINSPALLKSKEEAFAYLKKARESLHGLSNSCFKQSLFNLTDYIVNRIRI